MYKDESRGGKLCAIDVTGMLYRLNVARHYALLCLYIFYFAFNLIGVNGAKLQCELPRERRMPGANRQQRLYRDSPY
jgi:hypothetical protein